MIDVYWVVKDCPVTPPPNGWALYLGPDGRFVDLAKARRFATLDDAKAAIDANPYPWSLRAVPIENDPA